MEWSEALGLRLELDVVLGQAAPLIYLPGEDPGRRTYARVAAMSQSPLGKRPRALEVAAVLRCSSDGVEPAGSRIVIFAELGCALEGSRGGRLTAALGKAGGGSLESRGD